MQKNACAVRCAVWRNVHNSVLKVIVLLLVQSVIR